MTSLTKSAGAAGVGIFGLVGTLASQATRSVESIGRGLDMLDNFVTKQHAKQVGQDEIELTDFWSTLLKESKVEAARRDTKLAHELNADATLKSLYDENDARFRAAIKRAGERLGKEISLD